MTLVFCHLQLIVGVILFVMKGYQKNFSQMGATMKTPLLRFVTVEHTFLMLLAIILITVGYSTAKRAKDDVVKHKKTFIFYFIGFVLIMVSIPWPFRGFGHDWF